MENFNKKSYEAHENNYKEQGGLLQDPLLRKKSIDYWRHDRMYKLLSPLLYSGDEWLTVGDGVGNDANWLLSKGVSVVASDISDNILIEAKKKGYINRYCKENAENISFSDNSFKYVLCKEAYHHFPRPYIAVYEMIRISTDAIILIEPIDIGIQMPYIVFLKNILDRINVNLINKVWKNRYSFEAVGNYVYKVSEREIEKIAMGIGLPYIAFKGINDYWTEKFDLFQPITNKKLFKKVKWQIRKRNFLCKLGIIPYQIMSCIIFKKSPTEKEIMHLRENGYKLVKLAENPYLS